MAGMSHGNESGHAEPKRVQINVYGDHNVTAVGNSTTICTNENGSNGATATADDTCAAKVVEKVSNFVSKDHLREYGSIKPYIWGEKMAINSFFFKLDLKCVSNGHMKSGDHLMYRIFKVPDVHCSRVLLCGSPGIGKTTLCQKYVYDWATTRQSSLKANVVCEEDDPFGQFKVVVFLKLSQVKCGTIKDIMEERVFCDRLDDEERTQYFEYMKSHPEEFLFILDGINECNLSQLSGIKDLLEDKKYRGVYLVATSRPDLDAEPIERYMEHFHACFCVKGFSDDNVRKFIEKYLEENAKECDELKKEINENSDLMHLAQIPLLTPIICELRKTNKLPVSPTMTELLNHYATIVCKMSGRSGKDRDSGGELECLDQLALYGVLNNSMQFTADELKEHNVSEAVRKSGFLNVEQVFCNTLPPKEHFWCFPHKSIQVFLAARWLCVNWDSEKSRKTVDKMLEDITTFYAILVSICGLLSKDPEKTSCLRELIQKLSGDYFKKGWYCSRTKLMLECCYEAWQDDHSCIAKQIEKTEIEMGVLFSKIQLTNGGFTLHMTFREVQGLSLIMPLLKLSTLNLSDIIIQTREAKLLANSFLANDRRLTSVKFSNCCLSPDAVEAICLSLKEHPTLESVDFSCCDLSDKGMKAVAKLITESEIITNLRLGNHPSTSDNRRTIAECDPSLRTGDLQPVDTTDDSQSGPRQITKKLLAFGQQLESSPYTDEAIKELLIAVGRCESLEEISLLCRHVGNLISDWLNIFKKNKKNLKKIWIQLTSINDEIYNELVKFANDMPEQQEMKIIFKEDLCKSIKLESNIKSKIVLTLWSDSTTTHKTAPSLAHLIFESFFPGPKV